MVCKSAEGDGPCRVGTFGPPEESDEDLSREIRDDTPHHQ